MDPNVGRLVHPVAGLGIEIIKVDESPAGKKVIFDVIDHSLDFTFGPRPAHSMSFRNQAVVLSKIHKQRVELARTQFYLFHIVIEHDGWTTFKIFESVLMAL